LIPSTAIDAVIDGYMSKHNHGEVNGFYDLLENSGKYCQA